MAGKLIINTDASLTPLDQYHLCGSLNSPTTLVLYRIMLPALLWIYVLCRCRFSCSPDLNYQDVLFFLLVAQINQLSPLVWFRVFIFLLFMPLNSFLSYLFPNQVYQLWIFESLYFWCMCRWWMGLHNWLNLSVYFEVGLVF